MSLLIKGMELPKFGEKIIILTSSGYIEDVSGQVIEGVEVISVPTPHGRLIDVKDVQNEIDKVRPGRCYEDTWTLTVMDSAPTVIEAEESK